jgi:hypothetical protein
MRQLAARNWPIQRIAAELDYSPSAFSAMVRRTVGMPPAQFFRHAHQSHGCQRLIESAAGFVFSGGSKLFAATWNESRPALFITMIFSAESRYNQWVREHYRFLLRSAWALTGSRATAEDVVQDCFTSAWRFRHQLRDQSMARAWLFQIMRRHAFRHFDPVQSQTESLDEACEQGVNHHDALDAQLDVVKALSRIAPSIVKCWCFTTLTTCPRPRWPRRWILHRAPCSLAWRGPVKRSRRPAGACAVPQGPPPNLPQLPA